MPAKRQGAIGKSWVAAALLLAFCPLPAMGENSPGVLPWALPQANGGAAKKKASGKNNAKNGRNRQNSNGARPGPPGRVRTGSWGLVQALTGMAYFGYETATSALAGNQQRNNANYLGFSLEERGFLFDPRLWTHTLGMQFDRSALDSPLQSSATNGLGFNFSGALFSSRSFPLRIFFARRSARTNFSGPMDTRTGFHNLGLTWSLNQPKLANVTLSALFGKTTTDTTSLFLPFQERQESFGVGVSRSFHDWSLTADADYSKVRNSLFEFQYILRGQELRAHRSLGKRGEFTTSLHHLLRTESDRSRPLSRFALTTLQSSLIYRHSEKLQGFYSLTYLSNIREAAIFSALQSSTGTTRAGSPLQPNPTLRQAVVSPAGETARTAQAGWSYTVSPRLSFSGSLGHSILGTPEVPADQETRLLKSYTTTGASVSYSRNLGSWGTSWRAGLQRYWNRPLRGSNYADNNRSGSVGVARHLGRANWMSDFSYSEYNSGLGPGTLYRQERWANSLESRLARWLNFNLGVELLHVDSNYFSLRELNRNRENGVLLHGTFTNRRWGATVGRGLRNVNSAIFGLDLENPLSTILLSQVNPLVSPLSSADRYTYAVGSFRPARNLTFLGAYRRDNFLLPRGDFNRYTDMDLSLAYRLRKVILTAGYRRLHQETLMGRLNRDLLYVRVGRPFRIY